MIHNWKDSCVGLVLILWMILVVLILRMIAPLVDLSPSISTCQEQDNPANVKRFQSAFQVGFLPDTLTPTPQIETSNTYVDGACNQGLIISYTEKSDPSLVSLRLEIYPFLFPTDAHPIHSIKFASCRESYTKDGPWHTICTGHLTYDHWQSNVTMNSVFWIPLSRRIADSISFSDS